MGSLSILVVFSRDHYRSSDEKILVEMCIQNTNGWHPPIS